MRCVRGGVEVGRTYMTKSLAGSLSFQNSSTASQINLLVSTRQFSFPVGV